MNSEDVVVRFDASSKGNVGSIVTNVSIVLSRIALDSVGR